MTDPNWRRLAVYAVGLLGFCIAFDVTVWNPWVDALACVGFGAVLEFAFDAFGLRKAVADLRRANRDLREFRRDRERGDV